MRLGKKRLTDRGATTGVHSQPDKAFKTQLCQEACRYNRPISPGDQRRFDSPTRGTAIRWLRVVQVLLEFHAVLFVGGPDDFAIVDNDAEGELDFVAAAG